MADITEQELEQVGKFNCPICFAEMIVSMGHYADEPPLPTADCPECGFQALAANLEDDEIRERIFRYHLRLLLDKISQGEKARQLINMHPLFPHDRSDQLVDLMSNEIYPAIGPQSDDLTSPYSLSETKITTGILPPLSEEDIETVKKILGL